MAGRISWQIEFGGLDSSLVKLREVDRLLNSISRKGGFNGSTGGVPNANGSGGNTNIIPLGTSTAAKNGGIVEGATAGAIAGAVTNRNGGTSKSVSDSFKSIAEVNKKYTDLLEKTVKDAQINQFGLGGNATKSPFSDAAEKAFSHFQQEIIDVEVVSQKGLILRRTPPPPAPPYVSQYSNSIGPKLPGILKQIWSNRIAGPFKDLYAGGSGNNGIFGGGFIGGLLDKFGPFKAAIAGVTAVMVGLKIAVHLLSEGIKHGAEAYQQAARYGKSVGSTFGIMQAFKSIGIESPDLSLLQGQFNPKSRRYDAPGTDQVLGAARAGQFGNMQQLLNMSDEFKEAMKDAAVNSEEMAIAAKATQNLNMDTSAIAREWKTLLSQTAAELYLPLHLFLSLIKSALAAENLKLQFFNSLLQKIGVIPKGGINSQFPGGQGGSVSQATAWEKMGFVFKGPKPEHSLQETARNTKDTVIAVNRLNNTMTQVSAIFKVNSLLRLPSLP